MRGNLKAGKGQEKPKSSWGSIGVCAATGAERNPVIGLPGGAARECLAQLSLPHHCIPSPGALALAATVLLCLYVLPKPCLP